MTFNLLSERIRWLGLLPFHFENFPLCFIQIQVVEFQSLVVVDSNVEGSLDVTDRFDPLKDVRGIFRTFLGVTRKNKLLRASS